MKKITYSDLKCFIDSIRDLCRESYNRGMDELNAKNEIDKSRVKTEMIIAHGAALRKNRSLFNAIKKDGGFESTYNLVNHDGSMSFYYPGKTCTFTFGVANRLRKPFEDAYGALKLVSECTAFVMGEAATRAMVTYAFAEKNEWVKTVVDEIFSDIRTRISKMSATQVVKDLAMDRLGDAERRVWACIKRTAPKE